MITGYCSDYFLSDRTNGADRLIHLAESQGSKIVIPPKSNRIDQRKYGRHIYKARHLVECLLAKLKAFRRVSTCYEKLAKIYRAAILIAS
jgi:transposase